METAVQEAVAIDEGRAQIYDFLSGLLYKELSEGQIKNLSCADPSALGAASPLMEEGFRTMVTYTRSFIGDVRTELASDYAYAILACSAGKDDLFATPFESVFTSSEQLLMQEARDDVYRLFGEEHLTVADGLDVPEDHLSFEFDFMALLARRHAIALEEGDFQEAARLLQRQKGFHERHLLNWVDAYCDTLEKVARTAFYRGAAKAIRGWLHADGALLDDLAALFPADSAQQED